MLLQPFPPSALGLCSESMHLPVLPLHLCSSSLCHGHLQIHQEKCVKSPAGMCHGLTAVFSTPGKQMLWCREALWGCGDLGCVLTCNQLEAAVPPGEVCPKMVLLMGTQPGSWQCCLPCVLQHGGNVCTMCYCTSFTSDIQSAPLS